MHRFLLGTAAGIAIVIVIRFLMRMPLQAWLAALPWVVALMALTPGVLLVRAGHYIGGGLLLVATVLVLRRLLPLWIDRPATGRPRGPDDAVDEPPVTMTRVDALRMLSLHPDSSYQDVLEAHRRLRRSVHPDVPQTHWLGRRLDQARDVLLRPHDTPPLH